MSAPPTRELLGLSFLVACLFSGSIYGWAPFSSILIGEGFFSLDCGAGLRPCDAQQQEITLAFTIATSAMMIAAFPSGILCDQVGPVVTSMIAGTLCAGGAVALALLEPAHSAADAWRGYLVHASFSCLACGGNLAFFVCFKVVALYHYDKGKQVCRSPLGPPAAPRAVPRPRARPCARRGTRAGPHVECRAPRPLPA